MFTQEFEEYGPTTHGRSHNRIGQSFRAGRGMMEPAIIGTLAERPMHGYEIIKMLEKRSHGMWRPSPGSVYPTLQFLEEKGDVTCHERAGKKVYELTKSGETIAEQTSEQRKKWHENFARQMSNTRDVRIAMTESMRLMRTIHRNGNAAQNARLNEAITGFNNTLKHIIMENNT